LRRSGRNRQQDADDDEFSLRSRKKGTDAGTPSKYLFPKIWTAEEKDLFVSELLKHGKNFE
jgi:hypothetical protein